MGDKTGIEWTDATWNPTTGCDRVSPGCDNCYAMTLAKRLKAMGSPRYQADGDPRTSGPGFGITVHPNALDQALRWTRPRRIFVNSMSDLFHAKVPDEYIARVFAVMALADQHTFQVLTKRHGRMHSLLRNGEFQQQVYDAWGTLETPKGQPSMEDEPWPGWPLPNVWLGVSAEDQKRAELRIPYLHDTPAAVRYVSAEPLLGLIDTATSGLLARDEFDRGIDWLIVGGESGPGARPMHPRWAESLHRQCVAAGVPFLFKQWGDWTPMAPLKDGRFDFSKGITMTDDGNTYKAGDLDWPNGPRRGEAIRADFPHHHPKSMYRAGKKAAGRELYHDGRTFDEYPEGVAQ
ncbi:bacteriophage protein gp37 [Mycobacteroides abscessus subsp. abscessus]|uniref:DUF5131 family protein n=1 Tax=Mycobacteroides abscessus TaxID=36809 RepID=UPI0009A7800A|nr:phage Gp37/Gp68 family protein [Mycobacteroides abscessus]SLJ40726.1 bacteriophage protein gp37 [Mycobacteroides abscessus subsp. abscessus]